VCFCGCVCVCVFVCVCVVCMCVCVVCVCGVCLCVCVCVSVCMCVWCVYVCLWVCVCVVCMCVCVVCVCSVCVLCVCVCVCDLETSTMRGPRSELGCCVTERKHTSSNDCLFFLVWKNYLLSGINISYVEWFLLSFAILIKAFVFLISPSLIKNATFMYEITKNSISYWDCTVHYSGNIITKTS